MIDLFCFSYFVHAAHHHNHLATSNRLLWCTISIVSCWVWLPRAAHEECFLLWLSVLLLLLLLLNWRTLVWCVSIEQTLLQQYKAPSNWHAIKHCDSLITRERTKRAQYIDIFDIFRQNEKTIFWILIFALNTFKWCCLFLYLFSRTPLLQSVAFVLLVFRLLIPSSHPPTLVLFPLLLSLSLSLQVHHAYNFNKKNRKLFIKSNRFQKLVLKQAIKYVFTRSGIHIA